MLEKFIAKVQARINQPINIWVCDATLNELANETTQVLFQSGTMRFCFNEQEMCMTIRDRLYDKGNRVVSARLISGFGFEESQNPKDSIVL